MLTLMGALGEKPGVMSTKPSSLYARIRHNITCGSTDVEYIDICMCVYRHIHRRIVYIDIYIEALCI